MANTRIIDMQIKQVIRLYESGSSIRKISRELGVHRKTVKSYIEGYLKSGKSLNDLDDNETSIIKNLGLERKEIQREGRYLILKNFIDNRSKFKKKPGFTIDNFYKDYQSIVGNKGYSRTQFYRILNQIWHSPQGSIRLIHKYGDKLFVDFAGKKLNYIDRATGEEIEVEVLVTILPASQYIYVEAVPNQKLPNFIGGIMNALKFIGGVPKGIITDNLRGAVTKSGKYQSTINKTFQAMALHYNTTIDPTRPYRPKDKALVEGAVKIVYAAIYYEVSKHCHFSISDLNRSIGQELEKLNKRTLTNRDVSRDDLYNEEKEYLQALPRYRYELKEYRRAKVQKMGYVLCSEYRNYYSVPYRYIGKKIEMRYDSRTLEIYYQGDRIAIHALSTIKGTYITQKEHLSSNNRAYAEWNPEYFSKLGAQKGEFIQLYIELLIAQRPYPEQAYKQALGILALCRDYTSHRVNTACKMARQHPRYSFNMIKAILENKKDIEDTIKCKNENKQTIPDHDNVRGENYFN
jgi:transposase